MTSASTASSNGYVLTVAGAGRAARTLPTLAYPPMSDADEVEHRRAILDAAPPLPAEAVDLLRRLGLPVRHDDDGRPSPACSAE